MFSYLFDSIHEFIISQAYLLFKYFISLTSLIFIALTYILANMPASPLSATQLKDTERLMRSFTDWKTKRKQNGEKASQAYAAEILGLSQPGLNQYLNGKIPLNVEFLVLVNEKLGIAPENVSPSIAAEITRLAQAVPENDLDYRKVKLIDAAASAGSGSIVFSDDESKTLMFRRDYIERMVGQNAKLAACTVSGDSVIDLHIPDGSVVLANLSNVEKQSGKVYIFRIDSELYIKELSKSGDAWFARPRNNAKLKKYKPIPLGEGASIIGRVFWCGFSL